MRIGFERRLVRRPILSGRAVASIVPAALFLFPVHVSAQSSPPVRPPTREEVTRPTGQAPAPRAPRLEVEGEVERSPCALDRPEFAKIRFTVRGATFEGLDASIGTDLSSSYSALVGTEQPISVVCDIRDRAATILRNAGYVAAVEVPQQRIADGVVHFKVLRAHLTQVRVRGNATGAERILGGYLQRLTKETVFNRFAAERYLLLASDLPGYTVRLTLRPAGTEPGEVIGDVTVEKQPGEADINVEDLGSESLGPWGVLARAQLYGLTGLGDRTTLGVFSTADVDEQKTVQLGHEFRAGSEGMTFSGLFTYSWAHPSLPDGDFRAETLLATLQADYPFIRSVGHTLRGTIGLDYIDQDVTLDTIGVSRDRIRVAFGRLNFDSLSTDFTRGRSPVEPKWRFAASAELRQGFDIFGATKACGPAGAGCLGPGQVPPSRLEGISTATVVRGLLYGEYRPVPKLTFALGVRGQYAWDPLLSFEQFSVGNYTVGRGYDPGTLLGDRGWGTQAEVRFGSVVPKAPNKPAIEAYLFWDHGEVTSLEKLVVVDQPNELNSVGGGARITFDRFGLDASLAVPLSRVGVIERKPDPRFLVSLTTRIWPWSY